MTQRPCGRPRWVPSPLLLASAALHAGAGLACCCARACGRGRSAAWRRIICCSAAAGLWPRSQLLGPNWTRLPAQSADRGEVAITIDDGPDPEVTPQVLSQLARNRAHASFFCVGERVERYPDLAQEIVRRGHTMENHSQRHRHTFSLLGPSAHAGGDCSRAGRHCAGDRQSSALLSRAGGTA